jgi:methylated-DNA-[protein]-cysteine S-methyltransferase
MPKNLKVSEGLEVHRLESPLGPMTAASFEGNLVGLWFDGQKNFPQNIQSIVESPDNSTFNNLKAYLLAYFNKEEREPPKYAPFGTPFELSVWRETSLIPKGETSSYQKISKTLSKADIKSSPRAVAMALSFNPISIIVPCHRVLNIKGELCGYAGGLSRKEALLDLEGAQYKKMELA